MELHQENKDGKFIVYIDGRLDAETSVQVENRLNEFREEGHRKMVLDCSKVDYLSSAGIRLMLSLSKKLKADEGKLSICNLHEDVAEIIQMAGFEQILNIYPDQQSALEQS